MTMDSFGNQQMMMSSFMSSSLSTGLGRSCGKTSRMEVQGPCIMCSQMVLHCRVSKELGSGAFGTVYQAQWNFPGGKMAVAVKVMKPSIAVGSKVRFLQEAAVMGQFFHPNVIKLHGVVTVGEPVRLY